MSKRQEVRLKTTRSTDDPKVSEATKWLCEVTELKFPVALAVALGRKAAWGTRRSRGSRPDPDGLALIYLASCGHEVFKPLDDKEEAALREMKETMPDELREFLRQYGDQIRKALKKLKVSKEPEASEEPIVKDPPTTMNGYPVISSPLADAIVAGTADISGQVLDANRFALTRDNFVHISTKLTPAEVEDTTRLANELTRRLRIILQTDLDHRKKVLGSLGVPLNSLHAVLVAMKEIAPHAIVDRINQALTGQKGDKS